jgi:hypothetical protein
VARAHEGEVLFFGVAWHASEEECRAYVDEFDVPYENGLDIGDRVFRAYKVGYQPATILIAKTGAIAHTNFGPITEDELERAIDRYL